MSIYEIEVPTVNGEATTLEDYKGQLLLIIEYCKGLRTAPQFEGLKTLFGIHGKGFAVLGFPL